jgi:hypothetical protein
LFEVIDNGGDAGACVHFSNNRPEFERNRANPARNAVAFS